MKLVTAFICIFLVCANVNVIAVEADTSHMENIPLDLKKTLSLKMHFPQEATDNRIEGVVTTCFVITPEGRIKVKCMNGHPLLTADVKLQLENMIMNYDYALVNKPMIVRFRFEIQTY